MGAEEMLCFTHPNVAQARNLTDAVAVPSSDTVCCTYTLSYTDSQSPQQVALFGWASQTAV